MSAVRLAFGSFGTFRPYPANKYTVGHCVYVHKHYRGNGLGRVVLQELISAVRERDRHAMIGGIDSINTASIALHEESAFKHVGTFPQLAFKFGRWLDLSFDQLLLETPADPVDE